MSRFTHNVCLPCWKATFHKKPVQMAHRVMQKCCFCGKMTKAGIYVRQNPTHLLCKGNHKE